MRRTRIIIALVIILALAGLVIGIDVIRRKNAVVEPGSIPIYYRDRLVGTFKPEDLDRLTQVSFVDAEEGKTQEGWLLRDVLLLRLAPDRFKPDTTIVVVSSSRGKTASLTWSEVEDETNMVMFDLSNKGTLKLVSKLENLDTRDEWIQDVDEIRVGE
ncbi:MAG: hypothetical protein JXA89_11495 [Anaerolineae bacterium]|nr:hypothetical protein [Anaerolineae bacterium]